MTKVTDEVRRAFSLFDQDGDGALSVEELQAVLTRPGGGQPLSDDDVRAVIAEFDDNGDGLLQIEEFAKMWGPVLEASGMVGDSDDPDSKTSLSTSPPARDDAEARKSAKSKFKAKSKTGAAPKAAPKGAKPKAVPKAIPTERPTGDAAESPRDAGRQESSFRRMAQKVGGALAGSTGSFRKKAGEKGGEKGGKRGGEKPSSKVPLDLRPAVELLHGAVAALEQAERLEASALEASADTFERRLGVALAANEKAKAARVGDKKALAELIRSWDKNDDGEISKIELRQAVRGSLGVKATNGEIDNLFDDFDADGSGALDLSELRPCLNALQSAAEAAQEEASVLGELAQEQRAIETLYREASSTMEIVERSEAARAAQGASIAIKVATVMSRRRITVDHAVKNWPDVSSQGNVTRLAFRKGVYAQRVQTTDAELDVWFDEALEAIRSRDSQTAAVAAGAVPIKRVLFAAVQALADKEAEETSLTGEIGAARKKARSQQLAIDKRVTRAKEESMARRETVERAASEKQEAEAEAKAAKLASFKRRRDKKTADKAAFEERVNERRKSWSALDSHFATFGPPSAAPPTGSTIPAGVIQVA